MKDGTNAANRLFHPFLSFFYSFFGKSVCVQERYGQKRGPLLTSFFLLPSLPLFLLFSLRVAVGVLDNPRTFPPPFSLPPFPSFRRAMRVATVVPHVYSLFFFLFRIEESDCTLTSVWRPQPSPLSFSPPFFLWKKREGKKKWEKGVVSTPSPFFSFSI